MRRRALLVALLGLAACRDGIGTFRAEPAGAEPGEALRLTYAAGHQRYPAWSERGDSVYYSGASFAGVPATPGGIYRIAADGGAAAPVFARLQSPLQGGPRWFAAPAPSPDGQRLAIVELVEVGTPLGACEAGPTFCTLPEPLLVRGRIRVRETGDAPPAAADAVAEVAFAGRDPREQPPEARLYIDHVYPFQRRFADEGAVPSRPSWSPAGDRLVFSDGLRLLLWTPGAAAPAAIAGTEDGVLPAWSPDGARIAFTRVVRTDSVTQECGCVTPRGLAMDRRTGYPIVRREVWLISPDGTGAQLVGDGESPAWAPDGAALFVRRDDRIVQVGLDGVVIATIPGTEGGHDPAVSPDGGRLAFSRLDAAGAGRDVWVLELAR